MSNSKPPKPLGRQATGSLPPLETPEQIAYAQRLVEMTVEFQEQRANEHAIEGRPVDPSLLGPIRDRPHALDDGRAAAEERAREYEAALMSTSKGRHDLVLSAGEAARKAGKLATKANTAAEEAKHMAGDAQKVIVEVQKALADALAEVRKPKSTWKKLMEGGVILALLGVLTAAAISMFKADEAYTAGRSDHDDLVVIKTVVPRIEARAERTEASAARTEAVVQKLWESSQRADNARSAGLDTAPAKK